jgi:hypothetical protein
MVFLRGVSCSGEVSFNLDIALPRLVAGVETEEPGRSNESGELLAPRLTLDPTRE